MPEGLTNIFQTTVAGGGIASGTGATSLPVARAAPAEVASSSFAIIVEPNTPSAEIMEVTAGQGTTTWTVTRAAEPLDIAGVRTQTAFAHSAGALVEAIVSAAGLSRLLNVSAPGYGVASTLPSASSLGDKGLYVVTDQGGLSQAQSGAVKTIAVPPSKWGREQLETANNVALRQFRAALGNRTKARCNICVIGDSIWEGTGVTAVADRGVNRLAANLRSAFPVAGITGGQGFVPPQFASTTLTPPATLVGAPTVADQFGPGLRNITLTGTQTCTWTVVGTGCQVVFAKGAGAGTMGVSIDGGAVTNINANQATLSDSQVQFFSFPGGMGTHTVQVSAVSGTTFLDGIVVFNGDESAGITVHDCSHHGTSLQTVAANATYYQSAVGALGADLVVIALGVNDYDSARPVASFAADLSTLVTAIKATTPKVPSILIHADYDPYNHPAGWPAWSVYVGQFYQQALGDPALAIFDATLRMPTSQLTPNYGLYYTDNIHPSAAGHGVLADQLATFLSPR